MLRAFDRFKGLKLQKTDLMKLGVGTSEVGRAFTRELGGNNADSFTADHLAFFTQHGANGGQIRLPSVARPSKPFPSRGEITALPMKADEKIASPKRAQKSISSDLARVMIPNAKDLPSTSRWGELPCWARQSSRVTLQELMFQHSRWDLKPMVHSFSQHTAGNSLRVAHFTHGMLTLRNR